MTAPAGIDPAPLDRIRQAGGAELAQKILGLFLHHGPLRLETARDAAAKGDADALERSAHSLKSSAAQLGAERLAEICRQLEEGAKRGEMAGTSTLVSAADEAMKAYVAWASRHRGGPG